MKIALLLSGGVDSSLSLALLHEQGHSIEAFYLKIWIEDEMEQENCPWEEDLIYAKELCSRYGIPLHIVPFQQEYKQHIISYILQEVRANNTPNPDILCNTFIKFGAFASWLDPSFTHIATGHYAQTRIEHGNAILIQGVDPLKDQSYFLSRLHQDQLNRALFPIGHLHKYEVRALAEQYNLPSKHRKDSQGLCFLGKIHYTQFLLDNIGEQCGEIREYETNTLLGEHKGFYLYTLGQRKGLGLGGGPWFVLQKDEQKNIVYVSKSYDQYTYHRKEIHLHRFHWFQEQPIPTTLEAKVRHGKETYSVHISSENGGVKATLHTPDQGLTPGQFMVFYKDTVCLGSAVMTLPPPAL